MEKDLLKFDVAVIGLGAMGSAACRHLSQGPNSVVGIGPGEPTDLKIHTGVFASHYDEARLTRIVDKDDVWSKLAARAIDSYPSIEDESGIKFHHPVGSLRVTPFHKQPRDSLAAAYEVAKRNGAVVELLENGGELKARFPYFHFEERHAGVIERGGAGYVKPRAMVKAQLECAGRHGAHIVPETAVEIEATDDGVVVTTDGGRVISASKVLLCTDAYTNLLLPGKELSLQTFLVSVVLAEVGKEEMENLTGMPSIIWLLDNHPVFHSVYACPPVLYPDGKQYIKIGGSEWKPHATSKPEDIVQWFHGDGRPEETESLQKILTQLLPQTRFNSFQRKSCIVTYTATNYPYVTAMDGKPSPEAQVFVCTGGCGAAAKSSDEIGRMGALLVGHGVWKYDMEEQKFAAVFSKDLQHDAFQSAMVR